MRRISSAVFTGLTCVAFAVLAAVAQEQEPEPERPGDALSYGRDLFTSWCSNCHAGAAGETSFAPTLFGLYGRKAGAVESFAYTPRITSLGWTWDSQNLDQWLAAHSTESPTTSIRHLGVGNPKDRAALIAYIATLKAE